jgi:hypothetical protein
LAQADSFYQLDTQQGKQEKDWVEKKSGGTGFGLGLFCSLVIHFNCKAHVFDHVPDFLVGEAGSGEIAIYKQGVSNIEGQWLK